MALVSTVMVTFVHVSLCQSSLQELRVSFAETFTYIQSWFCVYELLDRVGETNLSQGGSSASGSQSVELTKHAAPVHAAVFVRLRAEAHIPSFPESVHVSDGFPPTGPGT